MHLPGVPHCVARPAGSTSPILNEECILDRVNALYRPCKLFGAAFLSGVFDEAAQPHGALDGLNVHVEGAHVDG